MNKSKELPYVSVCTPTYNRRPFIKSLIGCFNNQTYPKELIEWIIIDDGTDKIKDLVSSIENVKYYSYANKLKLGKKRNIANFYSKGKIIINMDDDDYYPPERIEHAVNVLMHTTNMCAGCNNFYLWNNKDFNMLHCESKKKNLYISSTLAFKKELLKGTQYDNEKCIQEEEYFLEKYENKISNLDPLKTILSVLHHQNMYYTNTFVNKNSYKLTNTNKTINDFIDDKTLYNFYSVNMTPLLKTYTYGNINNKIDLIFELLQKEHSLNEDFKKQLSFLENIKMQDETGNFLELNSNMIMSVIDDLQGSVKLMLELLELKNLNIDKICRETNKQIPDKGFNELLLQINRYN